jgi:hypothetical protein
MATGHRIAIILHCLKSLAGTRSAVEHFCPGEKIAAAEQQPAFGLFRS